MGQSLKINARAKFIKIIEVVTDVVGVVGVVGVVTEFFINFVDILLF